MQGGIANLPAGHIAATRYLLQEVQAHAVLLRQMSLPDQPAFGRFWRGKVDDDIQATREGGINAIARIGGDEHNAFVVFEALQEIIGLQIGIAVVGVAHLGPIGHQRIALVQQQHHVKFLGTRKHLVQVALGLADVFIHDRSQVHAVEVHLQLRRQHSRPQCLACSTRTAEQRAHASGEVVCKGSPRSFA